MTTSGGRIAAAWLAGMGEDLGSRGGGGGGGGSGSGSGVSGQHHDDDRPKRVGSNATRSDRFGMERRARVSPSSEYH